MHTNDELVARAVAAIPLWRAFLDGKEAELKAQLAQMRTPGTDTPTAPPARPDEEPSRVAVAHATVVPVEDNRAALATRMGLELEPAAGEEGGAEAPGGDLVREALLAALERGDLPPALHDTVAALRDDPASSGQREASQTGW